MVSKFSTVFPVGIVIAMLCILDFAVRLTPNPDVLISNDNITENVNFEVSFLTDTNRQKLDNLLAQFDIDVIEKIESKVVPKTIKPTVNLMPIEEQQKQQGKLVDLFDGEDKYSLVATFYDGDKYFGVFIKTHLPTGKKNYFRLYENENISNYTLSQVNNEFVEFTQGARTIQMRLFLIKKN